jgi:hypothetical protein
MNPLLAIKDAMLASVMSKESVNDGEGSTVETSDEDMTATMRYLPETGREGDVTIRVVAVEDGTEKFVEQVAHGDLIGVLAHGMTGLLTVWRTHDGGYRGNVRRCSTVIRKHRSDNLVDMTQWIIEVWPLLNIDYKCENYDITLFRNLPGTDLSVRRGAIVGSAEDALDMLQVYPVVAAAISNDDGVMLWITENGYVAAAMHAGKIVETTRALEIEGLRDATKQYWLQATKTQGNA